MIIVIVYRSTNAGEAAGEGDPSATANFKGVAFTACTPDPQGE